MGRPMERVQEKMESLGMLPSSVSVQSVGDDKPQGQPIPQTNGDSARGSCKDEVIFKVLCFLVLSSFTKNEERYLFCGCFFI